MEAPEIGLPNNTFDRTAGSHSLAAPGQRARSEALGAALTDAADAKARIAVYGSASAVEALARFEESGPVLDNPQSVDCFLRLASVRRLKGHQPTKDALRFVLFGQDHR